MQKITSLGLKNKVPNTPSTFDDGVNNLQATSQKTKNNGGVLGGVGYLGEKVALGFLSSVEGIWDYTAGGIAKFFGDDAWAEKQFATDWINYGKADERFNPSSGWQVAGDVASGIGTSLPALAGTAAGAVIAYASGGTLTPFAAGLISGSIAGFGAAGNATKEAYYTTGELGGKEFGYGALSGATEAGVELLSAGISKGTGRIVSKLAKETAKETAETVAKTGVKQIARHIAEDFAQEAFEEGLSEILSPVYKRMTYDKTAQNASLQEVAYAAMVGGLSGAVMSGTSIGINSAVNTTSNLISGNSAIKNGTAESIMETGRRIAESEARNDTGIEVFRAARETYTQLAESLKTTNGTVNTVKQKMLLGKLKRTNVIAELHPYIEKSARGIVFDAENVSKKLSSYGMRDAQGKALRFSAREIMAGIDASLVEKAKSGTLTKQEANTLLKQMRKALTSNSVLATLAVAEATGEIMIDTRRIAESELNGENLANTGDLNRLIERGKPEELQALGQALGIEDWSKITIDEFKNKITQFNENGGFSEFAEQSKRVRAAAEKSKESAKPLPRVLRKNMQDGVYRFASDNNTVNMALFKDGDAYHIYDYDTRNISRAMTVQDVNRVIKRFWEGDYAAPKQTEQYTQETNLARETLEIDKYALDNIPEYRSMSEPNKAVVRMTVRQARAHGLTEAETLTFAKVAAKSGLNIIFDSERAFGDGVIRGNTIYINPNNSEMRTYEVILAHEMFHKIFMEGDKRAFKLFKEAKKQITADKAAEIEARYKRFYEKSGVSNTAANVISQEEIAAAGVEEVFKNADAWAYILSKDPSVAEKVLSFFKKSAREYSSVQGLSAQARKFLRRYKALFESLSARNQGNNALSIALEGADMKMPVTNTETDSLHVTGDNGEKVFDNADTRLALSKGKAERLKNDLVKLGTLGIRLDAGGKSIRILTDKFTQNKNIFSNKGRNMREVNARIKSIPHFAEILRSCTYDGTDAEIHGLENEAKKGVVAMHRFKGTYGGFYIEAVVRDKGAKQFLYEIKFIEKEKSSQQSMTDESAFTAPLGDAENKLIITHPEEKSNTPDKISLKNPDDNNVEVFANANVDTDARYAIKYPNFSEADISSNMDAIADMEAIATIDASKLKKTGKSPMDTFNEYFRSLGNNITSETFGDIALPKSSTKSEIRHGITAEKIASIEAIPAVIEQGKVIFHKAKEGNVERIVVCAPIKIGEADYYMGVMLQRDARYQRLYLHNVASVAIEREATSSSKDDLVTTGALENENHLSITSIIQKALNVKAEKQKSGGHTPSANANAIAGTPEANSRSSTNSSITENAEKSNTSDKIFLKNPDDNNVEVFANADVDTDARYAIKGRNFTLHDDTHADIIESEAHTEKIEKSVEKYTENQYNSFGWARASEALSKAELDDLYSKMQSRSTLLSFKQSANGEAIIEVNNKPHTTLDTDNVFVFVKGNKNNFTVSRVVRFNIASETEMENIKGGLYERGKSSSTYLESLKKEGIAREYRREDFSTFAAYSERRSNGEASGRVDTHHRRSEKYRSGYSLTVGENGEVVEQSALKSDGGIYTSNDAKQYNSFGWARAAEALSKTELDDLYSKIQSHSTLRSFKQSANGEAIIEVNNKPHTTLDTDNVFVFVKGNKNNFTVSRVVRFDVATETEMNSIRRNLYEGRTCSDFYIGFYQKEGLAREYRVEDYPTFDAYSERRSNGEASGRTDTHHRRSEKYRSGYSLTVGENGEVVEQSALKSDGGIYTSNDAKQYNSFGWARAAEALSKAELDDLYSKIQSRSTLRSFKQSANGEAIIEVNNKPHTTLDTDNVFVFVKGNKNNFTVSRVVRFNVASETEMEAIRGGLYEGRTWSDSYCSFLSEEGLAKEYRRENFQLFTQYQQEIRRRRGGRESGRVDADYRGREKYRSGYSLTVGEDGEVVEQRALKSDGGIYTSNDAKQYNSFGWARAAEALSKTELDDLYSKIQSRSTLRSFKQSANGEAVVEVNSKSHTTLDTDNVFVFVKGKKDDFDITRVVRFNIKTETEMSIIKEDLYEGRTCSDTHIALYSEEGIAREYRRENFSTFNEYREGRSNGEASRRVDTHHRRSEKYRSGYSLTVGEDGEIVERYALKNDGDVITGKDVAEMYKMLENNGFSAQRIIARGIPRKSGTVTLTVGELKKRIAQDRNYKVFSKKVALETINKMSGTSNLTQKTRVKFADALWQGLNDCTTKESRINFSHDMAEYVVAKLLTEAKVENPNVIEAREKLSYLNTYIGKISFSPEYINEIHHIVDEAGLKKLIGRWGYKGKNGTYRVPMDVFVCDIAREMPGLADFENMHPVDAFIELNSIYESAKNDVKDKWVSAYWDMPDSDIPALVSEVESEIMKTFENDGEKSKFSKRLEGRIAQYKERTEFWKAEHDRIKGRDRILGLLMFKAQKMKELKIGTFANSTQYETKIFKNSIEELSRIQFRGNLLSVDKTRKIVADLHRWYTSENVQKGILGYESSENPGRYVQSVADMMEAISTGNKGFSQSDLTKLYNVMSYFTNFVETWSKVYRKGKWIEAKPEAERYVALLNENEKIKVGLFNRLTGAKLSRVYMEYFSDSMTVARRMDLYESGFYTEMLTELKYAAESTQVAEMEMLSAYDDFTKNHKKYIKTAQSEIVEYRGTEISKMQLISLYMSLKRKQAWAGLTLNGFTFYNANGRRIRVDGVITADTKLTNAELSQYITEQLSGIEALLTGVDKEYIAVLEQAYNVDARKLKAERDMQRLGFTNVTDDYYYPIRRGNIAKNVDSVDIAGELDRVSNSSFNKNTVRGAKQELFIESADDVFKRHIRAVSQYAYLSPVIETYNRLYNLDISGNNNKPISVATESANTWENGNKYFSKLISDVQGIYSSGDGPKILRRIRSGYAKFQLGANPKVWLTQLSSLFASSSILDADCIVRGMFVSANGIDEYCSTAKLRNNDNTAALAQAVIDSRTKRVVSAVDKFGDALMVPIGKMDRFVVNRLFGACQVQIQKNGGAKIGTESNKTEAGKLLRRVILETQQNSMATERSQAMRSNNEFLKTVTMFSADGMKVIGRVIDAAGEMSAVKARLKATTDADIRATLNLRLKAARRKFRKSVAALALSAVFMASIAQMFRWLYDKESKDENVTETMLVDTAGNLLGGLPLFKEVYGKIVEGYDLDNYTYSTLNDLFDSATTLFEVSGKLFLEKEGSIQEQNRAIRNLSYSVGQISGLPVRNLYNTFYGLTKRFNPETAYKIDNVFYEKNYKNDFYNAIENDDVEMASFILSLLYNERMGTDMSEIVHSELYSLSAKGYKVIPTSAPKSITIEGEEYELNEAQQIAIRENYSSSQTSLEKLFDKEKYKKLSEELKAEAVNYIYDLHYDMALEDTLGIDRGNEVLISSIIGAENLAMLHIATKSLTADTDKLGSTVSGSKRQKVVKAINQLDISSEQKLLLICVKGYTLKDGDLRGLSAERAKKLLLRYILGMSKLNKQQKAELVAMCGFGVKNGRIIVKTSS